MAYSRKFSYIFIFFATIITISQSCGCGNQLPPDPFDPLGKWHQRHMDCGIPSYAYRLPQAEQAKIQAIWTKYEAGDDCEAEQEATREVIFGIADEVRYAAFKGMCGPGFLSNESDDVRDAFFKVWSNDNLNLENKEVEFQKLAKQHLTGNAAQKFEKFIKNLKEGKKGREQTIQAMSPAGREAYNKWIAMRKQERAFLSGLPFEVRADLGLVCKCCGGCKSERKTQNSRAARSTHVSVDSLVGALQRADRQMLHDASDAVCN